MGGGGRREEGEEEAGTRRGLLGCFNGGPGIMRCDWDVESHRRSGWFGFVGRAGGA